MIRDAAVVVDSAAVAVRVRRAVAHAEELRVAHLARIAKRRGCHHVADGADRRIFGHPPPKVARVVNCSAREVDGLSEDVGVRFAQRTGLVVGEEVSGVFHDRVRELVGDDVVGCGPALAVDHLATDTVPERVLVRLARVLAVADGGAQLGAEAVIAVAPVRVEEVVVGGAREIVGLVDVVDRTGTLSLGPHERAWECTLEVRVIDRAVLRGGQLAEVQQDATAGRVHPDVLAQRLAGRLDEPRKSCWVRACIEHPSVEQFEPGLAVLRSSCQIGHVLLNEDTRRFLRGGRSQVGEPRWERPGQHAPVHCDDALASEVDQELARRDRNAFGNLSQPDVLEAQRVTLRFEQLHVGAIREAEGFPVLIDEGERALVGRRSGHARQQQPLAGAGGKGDEPCQG